MNLFTQSKLRRENLYAPAHPGSEDCLYLQAKVFIQSENCALNTHNECYFYWIF